MKEISLASVAPAGIAAQRPDRIPATAAEGFGQVLSQAVDAVNTRMQEADALARGLASGQHANIHETMIAAEQAGISFRLMTRVQQKALDAYLEIMRMQL
ncbi:MAG: flagellar hook-basal body complex protein FliE [Thermodesulfobacteriota bacterium]|jgi:flagellar hook-basal body complex protein FliE